VADATNSLSLTKAWVRPPPRTVTFMIEHVSTRSIRGLLRRPERPISDAERAALRRRVAVVEEEFQRIRRCPQTSLPIRREVARTLLETGELHRALGEADDARRVYLAIITTFEDDTDASLRVTVMAAHIAYGAELLELGRSQDAMEEYLAALRLGVDPGVPGTRKALVDAQLGHAAALHLSERYHEAALALALTVREFEQDPPEDAAPQLAYATLLTADFAAMFGDEDEALGVYDLLDERHGSSPSVFVRDVVGRGIINRARLLAMRGRIADAVDLLAGLLTSLGDEPDLQRVRALAWASHGHWLRSLGNVVGAAGSYRVVLAEFECSADPEISDRVAFARNELAELECYREKPFQATVRARDEGVRKA
jgi:tetratricopeptide (TPR) repeat protein